MRRAWLVLLLCILTGLLAGRARAADSRLTIELQISEDAASVARRVQSELELIGLVVRAAPSSNAEGSARSGVKLALLVSVPTETQALLRLWLLRPEHETLERSTEATVRDARELPSVAGVRAAELVQATLAEASLSALLQARTSESPSSTPPKSRAPPRPRVSAKPARPAFVVGGGGYVVLAGADAGGAAAAATMGRAFGAWTARLTALGPLRTRLEAAEGRASVRQLLLQAEIVWSPLHRARLGPHAFAGLGTNLVWSQGEPAGASYEAHDEQVWLLAGSAGLGLDFRPIDLLSLGMDARWYAARPTPTVEHGGETRALGAPGFLIGASIKGYF